MSDDDHEEYGSPFIDGDGYYDPDEDGVQIEPKQDEEEEDDYDESEEDPKSQPTKIARDRTTDNIMSKFEYARLVSALATLYAAGLEVHPKVEVEARTRKLYDPLDLAEVHISFRDVPCPVNIERPMPDGTFEIWKREEMILPSELVFVTDV